MLKWSDKGDITMSFTELTHENTLFKNIPKHFGDNFINNKDRNTNQSYGVGVTNGKGDRYIVMSCKYRMQIHTSSGVPVCVC